MFEKTKEPLIQDPWAIFTYLAVPSWRRFILGETKNNALNIKKLT
jgi:hypothetical protein